jgi:hypothetical protein
MTTLTLDQTVAVSDDAVFREIDGEAVVLNLETGMYYGLDEVGTCAWQAIAPSGTLRQGLSKILETFDVDRADGERDLLELASQLVGKGLWTLTP